MAGVLRAAARGLWLPVLGAALADARSFEIQNDTFLLDGAPFQIRSGEFHYARVPRAYWQDRLQRVLALGLNAISVYVPWNYHEEVEGQFNFDGERDFEAFIQVAKDQGLLVLLRAGPYICGEWEFGGFPAWVLQYNVTLRTYEDNYIKLVDNWWNVLLPKVKPLLYSNGGPIIMVQVENEYGSYGDTSKSPADKKYMEHLVDVANSIFGQGAALLYTTDGGDLAHIRAGSLPGPAVLSTGDGRWACDAEAQMNPPGGSPCMNSEDYTGWLTHWGERMAESAASDFGAAAALKAGHSFSLYMSHGGSNFGWHAGANGGGKDFQPHITSYDYNSPISEGGDHGVDKDGRDKFVAVREALGPWAPAGGFPAEPPALPKKAYGSVRLTASAPMLAPASLRLLALGGKAVELAAPVPMEALGQSYGFIYYTAVAAKSSVQVEVEGYPSDRAQVFVDGAYQGAIWRPQAAPLPLKSPVPAGGELGLLVENMGRLNYGGSMLDRKGLTGRVLLDGDPDVLGSWAAWSLPLLDFGQIASLPTSPTSACDTQTGPTFYFGKVTVEGTPADTWLRPEGFTKGNMWVNGFALGRYWNPLGPQQAFYMPAPYLQTGVNSVVLLELESGPADCTVRFADGPDLSGPAASRPVLPQSEGEKAHANSVIIM